MEEKIECKDCNGTGYDHSGNYPDHMTPCVECNGVGRLEATDKERLGKIKEAYSNAIDIALSAGETLPEYEIEVADLNFLVYQAEEKQLLEERVQDLEKQIKRHKKEKYRLIDEKKRYKQALHDLREYIDIHWKQGYAIAARLYIDQVLKGESK